MEWRLIEVSNGKYAVSEFGDIKSMFRHYKHKNVYRENPVKPTFGGKKRSYLKMNLSWKEDGITIKKSMFVHRLVGIAFVPIVEGKEHINHKDGNKKNNHYTNLEWCTPQENNEHGVRLGLLKRGKKPKVYSYVSKRTEWGMRKPIVDLSTGIFWTSDELAFILGIRRRYVHRMINEDRKPNTSQYRYA
jgi:hypothetical protein